MRSRIAFGTLVVSLIALGGIARAQSQTETQTTTTQTTTQSSMQTGDMKTIVSNLKSACSTDVNKFCQGVNPGNGRLLACVESREDQLSPACKSAWTEAKAQVSQKLDQVELAFRDSCGLDVSKYCSKVPSGRGRLLSCLDDHRENLSVACSRFRADIEKKLATDFG